MTGATQAALVALAALLAATAVAFLPAGRPSLTRVLPAAAPRRRVPTGWVLLLPVPVAVALLDLTTALLVSIVAGAGLGVRRLVGAARIRGEAEVRSAKVLEACESIAGDLAAGRPPGAALTHAAEVWPELAPAATAEALGADVPAALHALARLPGAQGLRVVAASWRVSAHAGAGLAVALTEVAGSLRADRASRLVVASELASARATARMLAVLPVVVLLMGSGAGGDPWGFLLGTVPGLLCLAAGTTLALLGVAWMERIARGVLA